MKCLLCDRRRARLGGEEHSILRGDSGQWFSTCAFWNCVLCARAPGGASRGEEVSKELACGDRPPSKKNNLTNLAFSVFFMLDSK